VRGRRIGSNICLVLATISLVLALVSGYLRLAVLDSDQFADRATAALDDSAVRDLIARQITDQAVLRANRDLVAVRPVVESAASAVVSTGAFKGLFRTAVRDLHRTVFTRDQSTATLTLLDVGVLLSNALESFAPQVAKQLPADFTAQLNTGETALNSLDTAGTADGVESLFWIFGVATALLLAAGILLAPQRRRGILRAGIGVAVAGALLVIAYQLGRTAVLARFSSPDDRAAAGAVWDVFLQDLRTWALVTLGAGVVIAAAAGSLLRPVDVRVPLRRVWDVVAATPSRGWVRALRAVGLIVAGALFIAWRQALLDVALVLVGVFILYQGVSELLRMLIDTRPAAEGEAEAEATHRHRRAPWIAGAVAALLLVLLGVAFVGSGATEAKAQEVGCNGSVVLCDRPLNEVAFPGTHNAMSSPAYPNWLFGQQETRIGTQLDDGIRALLIDAHYGRKVGNRVLTTLDGKTLDVAEQQLGQEGAAAATRIRDNLLSRSQKPGPQETWLCHVMCELGAFRLEAGLREIRDFVVAHPNQVLIVIVEDDGPTPADIAQATKDSGLLPFVYQGQTDPPADHWPTLGEMIDSGGRVVMLAEQQGGDPAVPWYHDGYKVMQEVPYHYSSADQMEHNCEVNRGGDSGGTLFLLNNWIDTYPIPRAANAARVNGYDYLLNRARLCQKERGLFPNILAVDLYREGDVLKVADTLNRIPSK
jgi:hypothetical protein